RPTQRAVMKIRELKRRLTWLWRFAQSRLQDHGIEGDRSALWIFDTIRQPDGGVLKEHMEAIARTNGLRLRSFGPRGATGADLFRTILKFIGVLGSAFRAD